MTATPLFFAAEITATKPGASTITIAEGHGAAPHGALAEFADAVQSTGTIYVSDMGYRTLSTDSQGVVPYPPLLAQGAQINVQMNLDPSQSGAAAAWGTISLANPTGQFDALSASWNSDGRPVRILCGQKTVESFAGYGTTRSTTGTYLGSDRTVHTAAAGVVRYDYSTGVPVALNEAAATNLLLHSGDVSAWSARNVTFVTGQASPDGGTAGVLVKSSGISAPEDANQNFTGAGSTAYTASIFAKPGGYNWLHLQMWDFSGAGSGVEAWFNLSTGAIGTVQNVGSGASGAAAIVACAGGYYRCVVSGIPTTAVSPALQVVARLSTGDGVNGITGDGVSGIVMWGGDVKAGALSSYVPTTGATVTRAADYLYLARGLALDPSYSTLAPAFVGLAAPWFLTDTALQVPLRDATYWLDRPLQTSLYGGTGTYDGTADLAGKPLPKTRGGTLGNPVCNVTPTLLDATNRIYQYNDGPGTVVNLYEGAAKTITFASDTTNLYAGSTPAGQYRTDNSRGLFQLGSAPVHAITADVTGRFPVAGVVTTAAAIARYLLSEDLALPAANLDTASFTAADSAYPYTAGLYFDSATAFTGIDAINVALAGLGAKLVPFRDGTLRLLVLRALPATATAAAAFSTANAASMVPHALPATLDPPPYRFRVGYSHNYSVQASDLNTATATAAQLQFVASADRFAAASSSTVLSSYLRPNDPAPVVGSLLKQADAQSMANDLVTLWSTRRRLYDVTLPVGIAVARDIGDIVSLVYPTGDLATGKLGQIIGYQFSSTDATVVLTVLV